MDNPTLTLKLVRHATIVIGLDGRTLLVDPMFDPVARRPPVANTVSQRRNPLVAVSEDPAVLANSVDAVLITHLHVDHFDESAAALLPRSVPIFCQPADASALKKRGYLRVAEVSDAIAWDGIEIVRTEGRHGSGEIGLRMGPVCGFVLRSGQRSIYVAGDTVWCEEVAAALRTHRPDVAVVNAGEARFIDGDPITMDSADVIATARAADGEVVAVHLEAINHCGLSRSALRAAALGAEVTVHVPNDGETLSWS